MLSLHLALEVLARPIGLELCVTVFVCVLSVDVLPDMRHPAHGPPGSTNANSHHPGRYQTPHLLSVHLLRLSVRFRLTVYSLISPVSHGNFIASSGLAFCLYGIGTRMHEISIPLPVRQNVISHLERPYGLLFAYSLHTVGVAYFVVFGSQHDVLWAWCFWRKDDTGTRTTADSGSGALIMEDSTLQKHPTLPDTEGVHEVRSGFSPIHTPGLT